MGLMPMNYYTCKFEREQKNRPLDWIIVPTGSGHCRLIFIGRGN